jgi:NNP family nitrate/nitrite transporter-like MFS transporter
MEMSKETSFLTHVPYLLSITAIFYLTFLARIALAPLMPTIEADLGIGHGKAGSLFLTISLGFFPGLLGSGFVSSCITHRWTIILSLVIAGGSLLAVSLSQTLWSIRGGLIMVGVSSGLYLPSGIATITDVVSSKHWGKAMAVHELAAVLSFISAPLLAEGLMIWLSWRGVLTVFAGAAFAAGGIFTFFGKGGAFYGEIPSPKNIRVLLRIPSFWIMIVFFGMGMGASLGVYSMLPLYLVAEEGLERGLANTLVAFSRIAGLGTIFLAGWATDRLGDRRTLGAAFLATGVATILLGLLHGGWIIPLLFLQPVLASGIFPASFAALSKIGPPQVRNVTVSLTMPMAYFIAGGVIPTGIGTLGDHGLFSLGFMLVGVLVAGCIILLRYLRVHEELGEL